MSKKELARDDASKEITVFDMEQYAGAGFENATSDAYAVPFLSVLQTLSKRVKKTNAEYVKGAEPGMLCDTSTNRIFSGEAGVQLIPVAYRQTIVEWVPRSAGGGKVAEHAPSKLASLTTAHNERNIPLTADGNELRDTRTHYCLLLNDDGSVKPVVLSLSSTHIKSSRLWMSMMSERKAPRKNGAGMFVLPSFSGIYRMVTRERVDGENSWFVPEFSFVNAVSDESIINAALEFKKVIDAGKVETTGDDSEEAVAQAPHADKF